MSNDYESQAEALGRRAREASRKLVLADAAARNRALAALAAALRADRGAIMAENARDLAAGRKAGLPAAMLDRLALNESHLEAMARSIDEIAALPDALGQVIESWERPNGLKIERLCVPLGVILVIYESRPNVTTDAAALCLKSGNACILRGGKETLLSNAALYRTIRKALGSAGLPQEAVQVIETPDHELVTALVRQDRWIDVVIARGGEKLIRAVVEHSTIPVMKHYKGVCHVYIDEFADLKMATEIAVNAKCQRPGVCNAAETLLVHQAHGGKFLAGLLAELEARNVKIRGCARTRAVFPAAEPATEDDWHAEYLDLILAVRVVDNIEQAIDHIAQYGSAHTESIVTQSGERAEQFVRGVDSSSVMVNASTRLADGGVYGLGAEIGISTDKLHARGPVGARDLTTYKYVVRGRGHLRT